MKRHKYLIMAGGTGGHIFPALSLAQELQNQGEQVVWLGRKNSMEEKIVKNAGIEIFCIESKPVRNGLKNLIQAPFSVLISFFAARKIIKQEQIDIVVGFGGFTTFAGGIAAWVLRKPLFIHEQNSIMGLANKILSRFAKIIFLAYPLPKPCSKCVESANPVRKEISKLAFELDDISHDLADKKSINILIFGGSLGALAINKIMPQTLLLLNKILHNQQKHLATNDEFKIKIIHQTGANKAEDCRLDYKNLNLDLEVNIVEFIEDMAEKLAWADIAICRAGALTLAEVSCAGLACVFVPYPFAVDNHQYFNAKYYVEKNAALLITQDVLTPEKLAETLAELVLNAEKRLHLGQNIRKLANPKATQEILAKIQANL